MSGEILAVSDADLYVLKQSAKATVGSAFKTALQFTEAQVTATIDGVAGEPSLGGGLYVGPDIGLSFQVQWSARGRVTMGSLPAFLFEWFCTRVTTGTGSGPFTHTYSPVLRNFQLPWLALGMVYGEGNTRGSGMAVRFVRDARLSGLEFTISSTDAFRFSINGPGLNMGPGTGSEGFTADSNAIQPAPTNPGVNTFTWPSWVSGSANLCIMNMTLRWVPQFQLAAPCLNSAEHAGMVVTAARWEVTMQLRADSDAMNFVDQIYYKQSATAARGAGKTYNALNPNYLTGDFSFAVASVEDMGASSPLNVPYQFTGTFPLQWTGANMRSDQSPNIIEVTAATYNSAWSLAMINDVTGTNMAL
jgi:hypothetical protein